MVIHSLMPKGVEQTIGKVASPVNVRVIHSLMPKGVEHESGNSGPAGCSK